MSLRRRNSSSIDNDSAFRLKTAIGEGPEWSVTYTHQGRKSLISTAQLLVVLLLSIAPWVPSMLVQYKVKEAQARVDLSREKSEEKLRELSRVLDERRQLKEQVQKYEEENARLLKDLKSHGDALDPENNQYKKAEQQEELYMARIDELENSIKQLSRNRLQQKYGGDYLQFRFNMINNVDQKSHSFTIETMSLEIVPHSTLVFHETIERKRLEGAVPEKEVGAPPCFKLQASKADSPTSQESIRFIEKSVDSSLENYSVLIARRGIRPAVIFCAGRYEYKGHDGETQSQFARVISGTEFLDLIANPRTAETTFAEWRVESVDILGSKEASSKQGSNSTNS